VNLLERVYDITGVKGTQSCVSLNTYLYAARTGVIDPRLDAIKVRAQHG
jgi:hypothetical protein